MQGFEFFCPTKIICGQHALDKVPSELESKGVSKPLVMTDAGLIKLGIVEKLTSVLNAAGVSYIVFDQVPPDSSMDIVNEVAQLFTNESCDGFIAIGGGSVIDTTKGAAASLACKGVDFATLQGSEILKYDLAPFIAIPTTAGTGSEVTLVAVVANTQAHAKLSFTSYKLVPHVAVLDPALTTSLPPKLTATTGMDALTHAIEAYTSIQKNPISDVFTIKAIELIVKNLPLACADGKNVEARENLALGSLLAGAAFSNAMVGMVHAIGHSLGGICHIPHGQAMMMLLPHCVKFNLDHGIHTKLYAELLPVLTSCKKAALLTSSEAAARPAFPSSPEAASFSTSPEAAARAFLGELSNMNKYYHEEYGVPLTLSELGVSRESIESIAKQARYDGAALYNATEISIEDASEILEACYE